MRVCPSCHCGSYGRPAVCPGCGIALDTSADRAGTALEGMVIDDKYTLTKLVGEGAMGWVYQGIHRALESTIAVKLMKPAPEPDDTRDERFAREARAASRINNPHVISIIDFGRTPGGMLYIVSELLRGDTLAELIERDGALGTERTVGIVDQVLSAIDEAHDAGLIHRDLKPENIIISPLRSGEDFVKVLDFGIAKLAEGGGKRLTLQGQLFGTPAYMAPEQIRGQGASAKSDLYACGLILYEMLTGKEAFPFESVMEVLTAQLAQQPTPPRQAAPEQDIPEALEAVVLQCVEKDPARRPASASELRKAIHRAVGLTTGAWPSVPSRICPTCRQSIQGSGRFCPHCGQPLAPQEAEDEDAVPQEAFSLGALPADPPLPEERRRSVEPGRWAGSAETMDAAVMIERWQSQEMPSLDSPPPLPRSDSEEFLLAHSTLNRRLRAEQTLRFKLVDRREEIQALSTLLDAGRGVGQIIGEEGSGRTRLLEVASSLAAKRGLRPLYTCSDPRLGRVPWYPIRRLVAAVLGVEHHEAPSRDALLAGALDVGLVEDDLMGLSVLFGLAPSGGQVEMAVRRRETRSVVLRALLDSEPARQGLCLLLDDIDTYDAASQAVLREVVAATGPARRVIVATADRPVLSPDVVDLTVEPSPLTAVEVEALLGQAMDIRAGSRHDLIQTITRHSEGAPLHVTQAVRLLAEGGTEVAEPLPDLIQTRVSRLPTEALRVLQSIAVLGWEAPASQVADLCDAEAHGDEALQLLRRRGLVRAQPGGVLRLAHPVVAEVVRQMMPADARRALHRRALEVLGAAGEDAITMARHAREARAGAQSLDVLWQAALEAEERLDDLGAARHYRRALQMARWELLYAEDDRQCLDLSYRLGETLHYAGDDRAAEMVLKEAVASAERNPAMQAKLLQALARTLDVQGRTEEAIQALQSGVRLAMIAGAAELLTDLYLLLARLYVAVGDTGRAVAELAEGIDLITVGEGPKASNAPANFWRLLLTLAERQQEVGDVRAALLNATAAMDHATRVGSDLGEARSHFTLSQILDAVGRVEAAERHHAAAVRAFRRLGDRRSTAEALLDKAEREPARSEELARQALTLSRQVSWDEGVRAASSMLEAR